MSVSVTAIKCPKCLDTIYSRAIHDFHACSCGSVTIDGGFDYCHFGWENDITSPEPFIIKINGVTKKDLYEDYQNRKNKYGIIKKGDPSAPA